MIHLIKTDSTNTDFIALVRDLDVYLAITDGTDHAFYAQFNKLDKIRFVIVAYENEKPVGCGAIKELMAGTMEIKRMYVTPENRGKGIASQLLSALENWAAELAFSQCMLETGIRQPEAIALYEKNGYERIPNYGQYAGIETSLCFKKEISQKKSL
jgi:GNAT superfamily N-acetyltransferase